MTTPPPAVRRFDIALSFPGEHRGYVEQVASRLADGFGQDRVLYDKFHDAEFARPDLDVYLPGLYRTQSELIVLFLCPEYANKRWCRLEWRHIRQLLATLDDERIMFLSFGNPGDQSDLGIVLGDGYIDLTNVTPHAATEKILKRLRLNQGITPSQKPSAPAGPFDLSRIDRYAPEFLIGRETELKLLSDAWNKTAAEEKGRPHVLTLVALGGEGKTSLVAHWAAKLAADDWPRCETAFAWSFYSQGAREQTQASSDLFLKEALVFFGDPETAASARHAGDKARRLAQLVGERRALLILDGLEPLQYPPGPPMDGRLKDDGIAALLKALAVSGRGLCIVTTRYSIPDLRAYRQSTAPEHKLLRLSTDAGVTLLRQLGVKTGSKADFEKLVEDVDGHALTLQIMGGFLARAFGGDIRRRDQVRFEKADNAIQGGHAFRAMSAYETWMALDTDEARRELAFLRLTGLFDRPAPWSCIESLLRPPAIPGLTEPIAGVSEQDRNLALDTLESAKLLTVNRDGSGAILSLDAHPLIREYFAKRLRETHAESWRAAHKRLYEYLCATTSDREPAPTLEALEHLYLAVVHGCHAGLQQEACINVYVDRILRGTGNGGFYSTRQLGAFGSDLGAIACFFEQPWKRVAPTLAEAHQAWLLNTTAVCLRALGRLAEAIEPMRAGLSMAIKQENWTGAAISAGNMSELELTLGRVADAARDAELSVIYADRCDDAGQRMLKRTTVGNALHHAGRHVDAEERFRDAERMQADLEPKYPLLYSLRGFQYCDLLMAEPERAVWRLVLDPEFVSPELGQIEPCRVVERRTVKVLEWQEMMRGAPQLDFALHHLTLGRVALCATILEGAGLSSKTSDLGHVETGLNSLRRLGVLHHLPRGLLARAMLRALSGDPAGAQSDLDEAHDIAERGPMRLFLADIHLHRARLFFRAAPYPWSTNPDGSPRGPRDDLAAAEKLINECGYHRRDEELADAKRVILGK